MGIIKVVGMNYREGDQVRGGSYPIMGRGGSSCRWRAWKGSDALNNHYPSYKKSLPS